MRSFVLAIVKVVVASLVSMVVLSLFCLLYWYSPGGTPDNTGSTSWKYPAYSYVSKMNEGFAFTRFDKNGYNNTDTFDSIDILFVGSSHMEALQVANSKNMSTLLGTEEYGGYNTYNIGISGHDFCQCISHLTNAYNTYNPRQYIIIETSSVKFSVDTIDKVLSGKDYSKEASTGIRQLLKIIPVWSSFYTQITTWAGLNKNSSNKNSESVDCNYQEKLSKLLALTNDIECKIIVVFHPIETLESDGTISFDVDEDYLHSFEDSCHENGIIFVNMIPDFEKYYYNNHVLPHGFINTAVGTGHLNVNGHQIIAERLASVISEDQN